MITVNGEKVWVPSRRQELVDGLTRMGVVQIDGHPLRSISKDELLKAYCQARAREVRRRQRAAGRHRKEPPTRELQCQLFTAWSVTD